MKRDSAIFPQIVILLLGAGVLAFLFREPQIEGRNVNATLFDIYFKDPALAYISLAFVPFFVGITMVNICVLKNGKAKAIRLLILEAICRALESQPGNILEYEKQQTIAF